MFHHNRVDLLLFAIHLLRSLSYLNGISNVVHSNICNIKINMTSIIRSNKQIKINKNKERKLLREIFNQQIKSLFLLFPGSHFSVHILIRISVTTKCWIIIAAWLIVVGTIACVNAGHLLFNILYTTLYTSVYMDVCINYGSHDRVILFNLE